MGFERIRQMYNLFGENDLPKFNRLEAGLYAENLPSIEDLAQNEKERAQRIIDHAKDLKTRSKAMIDLIPHKISTLESLVEIEKTPLPPEKPVPELGLALSEIRAASKRIKILELISFAEIPFTKKYIKSKTEHEFSRVRNALETATESVQFCSNPLGNKSSEDLLQKLLDSDDVTAVRTDDYSSLLQERNKIRSQIPEINSLLEFIKNDRSLRWNNEIFSQYIELDKARYNASQIDERDSTIRNLGERRWGLDTKVLNHTYDFIAEQNRSFGSLFSPISGYTKNAMSVTSELVQTIGEHNAYLAEGIFAERAKHNDVPSKGSDIDIFRIDLAKVADPDWTDPNCNGSLGRPEKLSNIAVSEGRVLTHISGNFRGILKTGVLGSRNVQTGVLKSEIPQGFCRENIEQNGVCFLADDIYSVGADPQSVVFCFSENNLLTPKSLGGGGFHITRHDGLHLLPEGYGVSNFNSSAIDLTKTPFKIMVHHTRINRIKDMLLTESVFKDKLNAMSEENRNRWFDTHLISYDHNINDLRSTHNPSSLETREQDKYTRFPAPLKKKILKDMPSIQKGYLRLTGGKYKTNIYEKELLEFVPVGISTHQYNKEEKATPHISAAKPRRGNFACLHETGHSHNAHDTRFAIVELLQDRNGTRVEKVRDANNELWARKMASDPCKHNELTQRNQRENVATQIYRLCRVPVPESYVDENGTLFKKFISGNPAHVSSIGKYEPAITNQLTNGIAVDIFLANWDVLLPGNILVDEKGIATRIDAGGALDYRAQNGKKDLVALEDVVELESMRFNERLNPLTHENYKHVSDQEIASQIKRIEPMRDDIMALIPDDIRPTFEKRFTKMTAWATNALEADLAIQVKKEASQVILRTMKPCKGPSF